MSHNTIADVPVSDLIRFGHHWTRAGHHLHCPDCQRRRTWAGLNPPPPEMCPAALVEVVWGMAELMDRLEAE